MKAGIVVDDWKLPIFRKNLQKSGYKFEERGRLTEDTSVLTVETEFPANLKIVLEQCERECRKQKFN